MSSSINDNSRANLDQPFRQHEKLDKLSENQLDTKSTHVASEALNSQKATTSASSQSSPKIKAVNIEEAVAAISDQVKQMKKDGGGKISQKDLKQIQSLLKTISSSMELTSKKEDGSDETSETRERIKELSNEIQKLSQDVDKQIYRDTYQTQLKEIKNQWQKGTISLSEGGVTENKDVDFFKRLGKQILNLAHSMFYSKETNAALKERAIQLAADTIAEELEQPHEELILEAKENFREKQENNLNALKKELRTLANTPDDKKFYEYFERELQTFGETPTKTDPEADEKHLTAFLKGAPKEQKKQFNSSKALTINVLKYSPSIEGALVTDQVDIKHVERDVKALKKIFPSIRDPQILYQLLNEIYRTSHELGKILTAQPENEQKYNEVMGIVYSSLLAVEQKTSQSPSSQDFKQAKLDILNYAKTNFSKNSWIEKFTLNDLDLPPLLTKAGIDTEPFKSLANTQSWEPPKVLKVSTPPLLPSSNDTIQKKMKELKFSCTPEQLEILENILNEHPQLFHGLKASHDVQALLDAAPVIKALGVQKVEMPKVIPLEAFRGAICGLRTGDAMGYGNTGDGYLTESDKNTENVLGKWDSNKENLLKGKDCFSDDTLLSYIAFEAIEQFRIENSEQDISIPALVFHISKAFMKYQDPTIDKHSAKRLHGVQITRAVNQMNTTSSLSRMNSGHENMGAGCGAAMWEGVLGLFFSGEENRDALTKISLALGATTHPNPMGYLGGTASALFMSFALDDVPLGEWPDLLLDQVDNPDIKSVVQAWGKDNPEAPREYENFKAAWQHYQHIGFTPEGRVKDMVYKEDGTVDVKKTALKADHLRNQFTFHLETAYPWQSKVDARFKDPSISQEQLAKLPTQERMKKVGWSGSSGHDAAIMSYHYIMMHAQALFPNDDVRNLKPSEIKKKLDEMSPEQKEEAYDALLIFSSQNGGDSDSTGAISGLLCGAMYTSSNIPEGYKNATYLLMPNISTPVNSKVLQFSKT